VGGRRMVQEFLLNGVLVEPGDGGQPPGDGGAGASSSFQFPGEPFDIGAADGEQGQGSGAAPGGELAQVQRVGLAGQPPVPGQESGEGEPFGIGEGRLDHSDGSGWAAVVIGHLPAGAGSREAGPAAGPSARAETQRRLFQPITPCHRPPELGARLTSREALQTADQARANCGDRRLVMPPRSTNSACRLRLVYRDGLGYW